MAAKLELRFSGAASINETISIGGTTFTFKQMRQYFGQVTAGTAVQSAQNFYSAFNVDVNYMNELTVNFYTTELAADGVTPLATPHGIVEIESASNSYFDTFTETGANITGVITTTPEELPSDLTLTISEKDPDDFVTPCEVFKLTIDTLYEFGTIKIYHNIASATPIATINATDTPFSLNLQKVSSPTTGVVKLIGAQGQVISQELFERVQYLNITSVAVNATLFGASIAINTTTNTNIEYSLDGTTWQTSNQYNGLLAGEYTAYARDNVGCQKIKTFTITEDDTTSLSAPPFIHIPIHNSIRFAKRKPTEDVKNLNFLNFTGKETPGLIQAKQFEQNYLQSDTVTTQFKSSYNAHAAYLIDCDGNESELTILQLSDNINRFNRYDGQYKDVDGKLAIYFTSGNIYNQDGTVQPEGHELNGLLPIWYESGLYVTIEGIGSTQIDYLVDEGDYVYAVTFMNGIGQGSAPITSIHTEHPYEVFEFAVNFGIDEGLYQIRLEYGNDGEFFLSEPIRVNAELDESFLTVQWWNKNNNDIIYSTGIRQLRRLEWENYFTLIPKSEKETYDTDTTVELVNSKSFAVYELVFRPLPMEYARGLVYGLDNSNTIVINGVVFVSETPVKLEPFGNDYILTAELTLTNETMNGQQIITDVVNTGFLEVDVVDGVGFLQL